ncbi:MAG TPA: membrane protein insertase YidC [Thermoanaerobaculia bacterium]|jgi:YidC/Oxa1 family membrane protein insertase|nr:membrane protein insertase YidC [Thermoanaerobaculia bacterium]
MEKRLLVAAALSLAVLLFWEWVGPKPPKRPAPVVAPTPAVASASPGSPAGAPPAVAAAAPSPAALPAPASAEAETLTTISNDVFKATFSNRGASLTSFVLTGHFDEQKRPLELVRTLPADFPRPLGLDFGSDAATTKKVAGALFVVERESPELVRFRYADAAIAVVKEIRLGKGYLFDVRVDVTGPAYSVLVGPGLRNPTEAERGSRYVMPASSVVATADGMKLVRAEKASDKDVWAIPAKSFAGIEDNYFLEALVPRAASTARVLSFALPRPEGKPSLEIATGVSGQGPFEASAYFGPKDVTILESYGLGLQRAVDFGWYGIVARPLLWLLKKTHGYVGNWGLAILVVTFLIRLLLFPLTAKSYISMKKMQKLTPKMNAIRDKYKKAKSDAQQRQKMNVELMALYQAEGANPMSGCLPMILQLPILVAFYNVLSRSIELRHAPFFLWIHDLSAIDSTYVLVILMIVSMYVQQAMTPATMDPAQKKIFMFMPVFMGFFFKDMPAGLVLYWLFSNLLTIGQQLVMNRIVKEDGPSPPGKGAKALKQARA